MEQKEENKNVDKISKKELVCIGGLVGVLLGGGLFHGFHNIKSPTRRAEFFETEDIKIMKVYNSRLKDQILIEKPENAGEYIAFSDYLKGFGGEDEKDLERAKIVYSILKEKVKQ